MGAELKTDGGPAFPYSALTPHGPNMYADNQGMTLRDYFAAKALQGMLSNSNIPLKGVVGAAYEIADMMLEEREK